MTARWTPREQLAGWAAGALAVLLLTVIVTEMIQESRARAEDAARLAVIESRLDAHQDLHRGDSGRGDGAHR